MRRSCAAVTLRASDDCAVDSSSLLLAVALLWLVVVPALNRATSTRAAAPDLQQASGLLKGHTV
jgi:hypothetical protein